MFSSCHQVRTYKKVYVTTHNWSSRDRLPLNELSSEINCMIIIYIIGFS